MDCLSVICLSSFFIRVETGYQEVYAHPPVGYYYAYDRNFADPWVEALTLGLDKQISEQIRYSLTIRHESMPRLPDRGVNAVWFTVEWRPFK